ncbi:MAG: nitroreductase family deazaflavin-dependent oxidoreductase [Hamadaea sp.]|nr:nitroreductase family deazaflavin-dependent oxidoreductase [Hamadaea sp.]
MYPRNRPNWLGRALNRLAVVQFGLGVLAPPNWVVLEVRGRTTGRTIACPVVVTTLDGERYLVAMLGRNVNWVRNVRASGGRAVVWRRSRQAVDLVDVPVALRAPVVRRYLQLAPGARPHIPVDRRASLSAFEAMAGQIPVFRIVLRDRGVPGTGPSPGDHRPPAGDL